jgi:hypothetical protein
LGALRYQHTAAVQRRPSATNHNGDKMLSAMRRVLHHAWKLAR